MRRPPTEPQRNEMGFTVFCVLAAFTFRTALGFTPLPGSLTQAHDLLGRTFCLAIFVGCAIGVAAFFWRDRDDAWLIEQLGLTVAGVGCVFYAGALLLSGQAFSQTALAAGAVLAIAVAFTVRWGRLQRWIRARKREAREARLQQEIP